MLCKFHSKSGCQSLTHFKSEIDSLKEVISKIDGETTVIEETRRNLNTIGNRILTDLSTKPLSKETAKNLLGKF